MQSRASIHAPRGRCQLPDWRAFPPPLRTRGRRPAPPTACSLSALGDSAASKSRAPERLPSTQGVELRFRGDWSPSRREPAGQEGSGEGLGAPSRPGSGPPKSLPRYRLRPSPVSRRQSSLDRAGQCSLPVPSRGRQSAMPAHWSATRTPLDRSPSRSSPLARLGLKESCWWRDRAIKGGRIRWRLRPGFASSSPGQRQFGVGIAQAR